MLFRFFKSSYDILNHVHKCKRGENRRGSLNIQKCFCSYMLLSPLAK